MGAKTGTKSGRPLKQNGKTKAQDKDEGTVGPDLSVLRKPVEISVLGVSEVVKVFQSCTPELRHLLSNECDVVYECKVCRNLFRSLANFISHKRVYCTQLHSNTHENLFKKNKRVDDSTLFVESESVRTTRAQETISVSPNVKGAKKVYEPKTRSSHAVPAPFRITIKKDLTSIVERIMQKNTTPTLTEVMGEVSTASEFYDNVSRELDERRKEAKLHTVHLEPIDNTSCGVFQTVVQTPDSKASLIKSQVQDLQRIMSNYEVVLGPDGKAIENGTVPNANQITRENRRKKMKADEVEYNGPRVTAPESEVELFCNICKEHFSSFKNLNRHMKSLHTILRTFYPCPCCKVPFSNSWSVYRHLLKVHRKTNEQIRKIREKVIKRSFKKEILLTGAQKLCKPNASENPLCPSEVIYDTARLHVPLSEKEKDKQWFGQVGDGPAMQCCGGCGRRFERRAAFLAHSQSCLKLSATKQNGSGLARTDKSSALGRPLTEAIKLTSGTLHSSVTPPMVPSLWPSSIPAHPLNHSIHLSQEKEAVPAKKIEIQVRKDYGKSHTSYCENRTRTPSTSRSEDGAASVGRSDDGMTSGSSETESSSFPSQDLKLKREAGYKHLESGAHESGVGSKKDKCSFPATLFLSKNSETHQTTFSVRRSVGRPSIRRSERVNFNGVCIKQNETSLDDDSDKARNDVKEEQPMQCDRIFSRKRKAEWESTLDSEDSKGGDCPDIVEHSLGNPDSGLQLQLSENGNMQAMSNVDKLQCLTCQKKYKSLVSLKRHLAMHLGWNRFRCIMCDFRCFSKCDCISHALSMHLDPWEKEKAAAMVQDIQMDAGGSTDVQVDSGDSDSAGSSSPISPEKSSVSGEILQNTDDSNPNSIEDFPGSSESETSPSLSTLTHESPSIDETGEIISVV